MITNDSILQEIEKARREKNAAVLAHYYVAGEVQDLADFCGDSLALARHSATLNADLVILAGVHFMAETTAIIAPEKRVAMPCDNLGCSLADGIQASDITQWKEKNPNGIVVSYVNTTAEVKAVTDICCTSSNAVKIVKDLPKGQKILFTPDRYLGQYVMKKTGREMEVWTADCEVHALILANKLLAALEEKKHAVALVHPESTCSSDEQVLNHPRIFIGSTSGMIAHAEQSDAEEFIVCTEIGLLHALKKRCPNKKMEIFSQYLKCCSMKRMSPKTILEALQHETYPVTVKEEIRIPAARAIQKMIDAS